jgi:hypothetical protein
VIGHQAEGIDDQPAVGTQPVEAVDDRVREGRMSEDRVAILGTEGDEVGGIGMGVVKVTETADGSRQLRPVSHGYQIRRRIERPSIPWQGETKAACGRRAIANRPYIWRIGGAASLGLRGCVGDNGE